MDNLEGWVKIIQEILGSRGCRQTTRHSGESRNDGNKAVVRLATQFDDTP